MKKISGKYSRQKCIQRLWEPTQKQFCEMKWVGGRFTCVDDDSFVGKANETGESLLKLISANYNEKKPITAGGSRF
jgi:hypothetical protein